MRFVSGACATDRYINMNPLHGFLDDYGPGHDCQPVPEERIASYADRLPEPLLEFWRVEGFCGYNDGLLWFVDPEEYIDILDEWKVVEHTAFARTGFADLFLWSPTGWSLLNVHLGSVNPMGSSNLPNIFNELLRLESVKDGLLLRKIHCKAVSRLGRIFPDECYTFVPALALGGPGTPESVQRVKVREQLSILAQIHGR